MMVIDQKIFDVLRAMPVFKPEMRQANRDGRKSQTRRVIDPQPEVRPANYMRFYPNVTAKNRKHYGTEEHMRRNLPFDFCRYGKAGDLVYMREPLYHGFGGVAYYRDDLTMVRHALTGEAITWRWEKDVLTSIFMPKEAARSIYQYKEIRVERVQEISRDDARAEGVGGVWKNPPEKEEHYSRVLLNPYIANYSMLWDMINAERGYPWESNPWVWVLGYKPVKIFGNHVIGDRISGLHADLVIFDDPFKTRGDVPNHLSETRFRQEYENKWETDNG